MDNIKIVDKLLDKIESGRVYHLFYEESAGAVKRNRRVIMFVTENCGIVAFTVNEFLNSIVAGGSRRTQGSMTTCKTRHLCTVDTETGLVTVSTNRSIQTRVGKRGAKLLPALGACLGICDNNNPKLKKVVAFTHNDTPDKHCSGHTFTRYTPEQEIKVAKCYWIEESKFTFLDAKVIDSDDLPITSVIEPITNADPKKEGIIIRLLKAIFGG